MTFRTEGEPVYMISVAAQLTGLHRGGQGGAGNMAVRWPLRVLQRALAEGGIEDTAPASITPYALGQIDGVELGFTDGAALPGGGWVFCAAAERTDNSVADGPCAGSAVGVVDGRGQLTALHRLAGRRKVEGIAARLRPGGADLCLVTDADDPGQAALMLMAQLQDATLAAASQRQRTMHA